MEGPVSYVLRVWMPDRPGALGAVASRVGAVGGDVAGIEIIERGAGRAVDELIVELPDPALLELLAREVDEVDGVDVEEIRPLVSSRADRLALLRIAADLVGSTERADLLSALCRGAFGGIGAHWAAVVDLAGGAVVDVSGESPDEEWLVAFATGASSSPEAARTGAGCDDVCWAPLRPGELVLLAGREGASFRPPERAELCGLADVARARLVEL